MNQSYAAGSFTPASIPSAETTAHKESYQSYLLLYAESADEYSAETAYIVPVPGGTGSGRPRY